MRAESRDVRGRVVATSRSRRERRPIPPCLLCRMSGCVSLELGEHAPAAFLVIAILLVTRAQDASPLI
ncbi:hypothetical protein EVAR_18721_1 [Eumeta japonica]|uniref:Uncharacterized protein n=1 Tax=Eumeta variegata TaxID=151549 RepID=A0A4C1UM72_EUMVA|nr:hypothetical protein EVAR_18721_1 [Eumeta japonica]